MRRFHQKQGRNSFPTEKPDSACRWIEGKMLRRFTEHLSSLPRIVLDEEEESDLLLLGCGALSPLKGFLNREDYYSVLHRCRLADGRLWPLPIVLSLQAEEVKALPASGPVALYKADGQVLGLLFLSRVFPRNLKEEARLVYGTEDEKHPGVAVLMRKGSYLAGGEVFALRPQETPEYPWEPEETKRLIHEKGWRTVVGFQTRNPIHRAHEYLQKTALELVDGLLLHPLVGKTKAGDIPVEIRLRCYEALIDGYYPKSRVLLGVFPAAMRYAGPREALFHALVRKNYGCTHMIIGRDHAGVGAYYGTYEAQEFCARFQSELGVEILPFDHAFYCHKCAQMATEKTCPHGDRDRLILSGTKVREVLKSGGDLPAEFTRAEVAAILKNSYTQDSFAAKSCLVECRS